MEFLRLIKELFEWAVPVLDNVPVIRAIMGIILVCFAPGFAWTLVLFKQINHIEILVLSFGLSLALVTLSILVLNAVIDVRVTGLNMLFTIILLIIIPLAVYFTRRYVQKRKMRLMDEE